MRIPGTAPPTPPSKPDVFSWAISVGFFACIGLVATRGFVFFLGTISVVLLASCIWALANVVQAVRDDARAAKEKK